MTDQTRLAFVHHENAFVDFDREPLMPKLVSTEGPFMAVADVNGDGLDDIFIGGAKNQAGKLLIQQRDGAFISSSEKDRSGQAPAGRGTAVGAAVAGAPQKGCPTGTTGCPAMPLTTPAADAYQATAAVTSPM